MFLLGPPPREQQSYSPNILIHSLDGIKKSFEKAHWNECSCKAPTSGTTKLFPFEF